MTWPAPPTGSAPGRAEEGGSALLVTLILLVVLTVIGIAGMGASVLQERMAGNLQDSAQVFEATESALRLCTRRVDAGDSGALGQADADDWSDFETGGALSPDRAEAFQPTPDSPLTTKGATEYQLHCLIEFTGPVDAARSGGSVRRPSPSGNLVGYRITAGGVRVGDGETDRQRPTVILQSDVVVRN